MRITVSGASYTGKTSLIAGLAEQLPTYQTFDEPYWLMVEEGYPFSDPPTLEDYEQQMERAIQVVDHSADDSLIDRCPLDFLALAGALPDGHHLLAERWAPAVRPALARIDVILYLPVEVPDRIELPSTEDAEFRRRVDELLGELVVDGPSGLVADTEVVEVTGRLDERVRTVLDVLRART